MGKRVAILGLALISKMRRKMSPTLQDCSVIVIIDSMLKSEASPQPPPGLR